jgi:SPP1 gp7 family putative phage head morphogenesis protein
MMDQLLKRFRSQPEEIVIPMGDVGWSESRLYNGDFPKYNPDELIGRKGYGIYRKMMVDEQVKAVVKFKRDAITSRDFVFRIDDDRLSASESERRVSIYEEMIDVMEGSFNDGLNYIMTAMYQGFSLTEQVFDLFEYEDKPYMGLSRLNPKPYETFRFKLDEYGNIEECIQELDGKTQVIDLSKFVYFTHNPEFDQHYGQSELREAYRSYYSKDIVIRLYNQFLERFAGGFVVAKPTEGMTLTQGTKEYNGILAAINNIRQQTSILFPAKMDLEMHQPSSTDQFEKAITMHDLQIAKALLVPNLLGITHQGDTGSFAQASTQLEAFLWTLDADAKRLKDALNEQIFMQLNRINFADGIGPRIHFKPVSEQKKFDVIRVWSDLVGKKAVEVTDTDEDHLRQMLDFPDKGEPVSKPVEVIPEESDEEPAVSGDVEQPVGQPAVDDDVADMSVLGKPSGQIVSNAAFTRALKRVSFTVIERKTQGIETQHTVTIESSLADMLANMILEIEEKQLGTPEGGIDNIHKLDFNGSDKTKVRKTVDAMLKDAWNLGSKHANDEISSAKKAPFKANMKRIADLASDFLKNNGFVMMGNLSGLMRAEVLNILSNGVKYSWTTKDMVQKIYDTLTRKGVIALESNGMATARAVEEVAEALQMTTGGTHRIATVVRTNAFEAINEARYSEFTDPALDDFIEGLEYSAILDDRTTQICTHLDGRIYPKDSGEWDSIRPPNHYNCRSLLVPVTIIDEVEGKDSEKGSIYSKPSSISPQDGFGGETG